MSPERKTASGGRERSNEAVWLASAATLVEGMEKAIGQTQAESPQAGSDLQHAEAQASALGAADTGTSGRNANPPSRQSSIKAFTILKICRPGGASRARLEQDVFFAPSRPRPRLAGSKIACARACGAGFSAHGHLCLRDRPLHRGGAGANLRNPAKHEGFRAQDSSRDRGTHPPRDHRRLGGHDLVEGRSGPGTGGREPLLRRRLWLRLTGDSKALSTGGCSRVKTAA